VFFFTLRPKQFVTNDAFPTTRRPPSLHPCRLVTSDHLRTVSSPSPFADTDYLREQRKNTLCFLAPHHGDKNTHSSTCARRRTPPHPRHLLVNMEPRPSSTASPEERLDAALARLLGAYPGLPPPVEAGQPAALAAGPPEPAEYGGVDPAPYDDFALPMLDVDEEAADVAAAPWGIK